MEKPEVLVGSLEEDFKQRIISVFNNAPFDPRIPETRLDEIISDFKTSLEAEAWTAFELAQSFSLNAERHQLEEDKARYREKLDVFNAQVRAFRNHVKAHNEKHAENEALPEEETPAS